jgi:CxxC motif-containing protein
VLKILMKPIMKETVKARVKPPVKAGDIIVKNVMKTGSDLISTTDWPG